VAALRQLEVREHCGALECYVAEDRAVGVVDRRLECRCANVPVEDTWVRVVENRGFNLTLEQQPRLAHEELVERVLAGDQDGEPMAASTCASPLLAQRRNGARETDGDRAVEQADVDPELERIRCGDTEQLTL